MKYTQKLFKTIRYSFVLAVIILGLITIIGTGGSDSDSGDTGGNGSNGNETSEKTRDFAAPEEFMNNSDVSEAISARNFPTYLQESPPNLEGLYLLDGAITDSAFPQPVEDDRVGRRVSREACLFNQTADGQIDVTEEASAPGIEEGFIADGSGNYITGSDNSFTLWQAVETEIPGTDGCKAYNVVIISGTKRMDGDLEFRSLLVNLDSDGNCPDEMVIANWYETEGNAYWQGTCGDETYVVTATADTGGSVSPSSRSVDVGSTASFTATANSGYTRNETVGGTCPDGAWSGSTYTTGAVNGDCSVSFSFSEDAGPPDSITNSFGMTFNYIEPGTFMMGSPEDELGRSDTHETQHEVTLTQGYYMQTTEVTQEQWTAVMGDNISYFYDCGDDCPVEDVSWHHITHVFLEALNSMVEESYRLPTEAEWEYAARAGSTTAFANGEITETSYGGEIPESAYVYDPVLDSMGWYGYNSEVSYDSCKTRDDDTPCLGTHPVAQKDPNAWGLYDMHGNVAELVADLYDVYPDTAVTDPTGPSSGTDRVVRGGHFFSRAEGCRSAHRGGASPGGMGPDYGFRLVLIPVH